MSGFEAIFGVVTGGAGLVSLGMQLTDSAMRLRRLYQTIKTAPKALNDLSENVETMVTLLHLLNQYQNLQKQNSLQIVIARCLADCERCSQDVQQLIDKLQRGIEKQRRFGSIHSAFKTQDIKELSDRLEKAKTSLTMACTTQILMSSQYILHQNEEGHKKTQNHILAVGEQLVDQVQARASPDDQEIVVLGSTAKPGMKVTRRPKEQHKTSYRFIFRLPYQLCRRVWDANISLTQSRMNVDIRTYNIVSEDSKVFLMCERGDLLGMQQMLRNGKAGLLDVRPNYVNPTYFQTLIECAAKEGQIHICRYLLSQTTWPDHATVLEKALGRFALASSDDSPYSNVVISALEPREMYRLFVEAPDFDLNTDPFNSPGYLKGGYWWLEYCPDIACLNVMLQHLWPNSESIPTQTKFDFAVTAIHAENLWPDASEFLQFLGLHASDRELAALRFRGLEGNQSVLFFIVHRLITSSRRGKSGLDWVNLGTEVLKNDADTAGLMFDTYGSPTTPLLQCLGLPIPEWRTLERPMRMLQLWINMVYNAGIDLCEYGAKERKVWESLPERDLDIVGLFDPHSGLPRVLVEQLLIGPTPTYWTFIVRELSLMIVSFELRDLPGSFPRDPRVPTKIIWRPDTPAERDEGHWERVAVHSLPSRSSAMTLQHAIAHSQETIPPSFITISKDTQDDAGTIALLVLREHKASRSQRSSACRSRSQPPRSHGKDWRGEQDSNWQIRKWLPRCHFCAIDLKWSWEHCPETGYEELKDCVRERPKDPTSAQGSWHWGRHSFLGLIASCQDGLWRVKLEENGHTGTLNCPKKCGTIDLKSLCVPEELKQFHPRRKWDPSDFID